MLEKAFQKIGFSTQKKQEGLCHNGIENSGYNTDEEGFNIMTKGKLFLIFYFVILFSKGVLADDEKLESVASFPCYSAAALQCCIFEHCSVTENNVLCYPT